MNKNPNVVRVQHRPLSFEAMQWTGKNSADIGGFTGGTVEVVEYHYETVRSGPGPYLRIFRGERDIKPGEWVLRDGLDYRILSEEEFQTEFMSAAE